MVRKSVRDSLGGPVLKWWLPAVFLVSLFLHHPCLGAAETGETRISGTMLSPDDRPLAGVIMLEKGRLYSKNFKYGGLVDEDGHFSVKVDEGGDYGLHLYATGHIYFPVGITVRKGEDNRFTFRLPPNAAVKDAPVISDVRLEPSTDKVGLVVIRYSVHDPNENLSHQVLGANIKTQEGFLFSPPQMVFPWTRNYPNGAYSLTYNTGGRPFDPKEWIIVAANNRCYNSSVLRYPFTAEGVVAAHKAGVRETPPASAQRTQKLSQAELAELGRKTFADNCAVCHYPDQEKTKVGPGLKGLFKRKFTPARKVPVTEENIRNQIQKGGIQMPPYSHIQDEKLTALLVYLRSL